MTACALDSAGQVVMVERRLGTTLEALLCFLRALEGPVTVAVEATLHWAWVHDQLSTMGWLVEPSIFDVWVGGDSQADLHAELTIEPWM